MIRRFVLLARAGERLGCAGIIVDARDESADGFCCKCDSVGVEAETWPHRMFLPIATARAAVEAA